MSCPSPSDSELTAFLDDQQVDFWLQKVVLAFESLPQHLLERIFEYLSSRDCVECMLVCKIWSLAASARLYKAVVLTRDYSMHRILRASPFNLAKVERLHLKSLRLVEMGDLQILIEALPNLTSFKLENYSNGSNILISIISNNLVLLKSLSITNCPISDAKIKLLVDKCKFLEYLNLSGTLVSEFGMCELLKHPNIQILKLENLPRFKQPIPIVQNTKLKQLNLSGTSIHYKIYETLKRNLNSRIVKRKSKIPVLKSKTFID